MMILGVCGQTGAGKSTVCSMFSAGGWVCIDTDRVARRILYKGKPCLADLVARFGEGILTSRGSLDRAALAAVAFSSSENQKDLNAITHPYIIDAIKRWLTKQEKTGAAVAVIDAPLLFESGANTLCDRTLAVLSSRENCIGRASERDGIAAERVEARLMHQKGREELLSLCDDFIENDGDLDTLYKKVKGYMQTIERMRA